MYCPQKVTEGFARMELMQTDQLERNQKVVTHLMKLFAKKNIDSEVIESVAYETEYNIDTAANRLLEIAETNGSQNGNPGGDTRVEEVPVIPPEEQNIRRIIEDTARGIRIMILMRGLPGSGKSYLANRIVQEALGPCETANHILSADDFFYRNGRYMYDGRLISNAHEWNQARAERLMNKGVSPIIIDNTSLMVWMLEKYCRWAVQNTYAIEILEPNTPWAFDERALSRKNQHRVTRERIRDMMEKYERNITVQTLFSTFNLCYRERVPPVLRSFPLVKRNKPIQNANLKTRVAEYDTACGITGAGDNDDVIVISEEEHCPDNWEDLCSETAAAEQKHVATSTDMSDFTTLSNPFTALTSKVVTANSTFQSNGAAKRVYNRDGFFDKGTMTEGDDDVVLGDIEQLSSIFSHIPVEYLMDVYDKCNGDLNWATDILLEDKQEIIPNYAPVSSAKVEVDADDGVEVIEDPMPEDPDEKARHEAEAASIKPQLELSVVMNDNYYSDHVKKIKHRRSGETSAPAAPAEDLQVMPIDSDVLIEDDSDDDCFIVSCDSDDSGKEELIELKMGSGLVQQLEGLFGGEDQILPVGYQPVIEVPQALAKQLYALYLESVYKQMDNHKAILEEMIREDEEFARKLMREEEVQQPPSVPDLGAIMKEQALFGMQHKINEEWRNKTPDDIACKLTKIKLIDMFPSISVDDLVEIWNAHNRCYNATVEAITSSGISPHDPAGNIQEDPLPEDTYLEMSAAYGFSTHEEEEVLSAEQYRQMAQRYQQQRHEYRIKADQYHAKGWMEVAWFYWDLASKQTQQCEKYNNLAAEQILNDNFIKTQNFETIDLHQLRVKESIIALDRFLDMNINLLQGESQKLSNYVLIITGRGKNSPGGVARIRPVIQKRLKQRKIPFEKVNPGLLRAKVCKASKMTHFFSEE